MIRKIINIVSFYKKKSLLSVLFYSFILIATEIISVALLFPLLTIVFKQENIFIEKFENFLVEYDLIFFNFFVTFSLFILLIYVLRFFISSGLYFIVMDYKTTIQKFFSKIAISLYLEGPYLDFKNKNSNQFSILISKETEKFANAVDAMIKAFIDGLIVITIVIILLYQNFIVSLYLISILLVIFLAIRFFF